jgi:dienelactone hydrolase
MRALALAVLAFCSPAAFAAMQSQAVEWELDGTQFSGFVVYDDAGAGAKKPGVLLIPNWMGVSEAAVERAKEIARDQYVVLVADVFGKDVRPKNPQEAGAAAKAAYSDPARLRARAAKALEVLTANASGAPLDAARVAAVGYCFGGSTALELARSGADLDGVITFHGGLDSPIPATPGSVKASVLVLNGANDQSVPAEQIQGFEKEMNAAGADWQFVNFSGAVHCFAEPDANRPPGCVYHERSAKRAREMMEEFLEERFGAP